MQLGNAAATTCLPETAFSPGHRKGVPQPKRQAAGGGMSGSALKGTNTAEVRLEILRRKQRQLTVIWWWEKKGHLTLFCDVERIEGRCRGHWDW